MAKDGKYTIKLYFGEIRQILMTLFTTIGTVSNSQNQLQVSGKARGVDGKEEDLE